MPTEAEPTPEQMVEAVYQFAAEQMAAGATDAQIKASLVESGLDAEIADTVIANLKEARSGAIRKAGAKNMLFGALWCIGGIVVTALTYNAAKGGGRYVVAWGAVVFGAIQFIHGMVQASRGE